MRKSWEEGMGTRNEGREVKGNEKGGEKEEH